MTRRAFWWNVVALCCGLVAAILLAYLPPEVTRYTQKGEAPFPIYANPTEAGKWWAKYQVLASRAGPVLPFLAFLFQLVALWFRRGNHEVEPVTLLDDFVSSALAGISRGIRGANEDLRASGTITGSNFFLEPSGTDRLIEFDVAVTSKAEGSGKVSVVGAGGSFALAKETVSRIKFVVHVKNWHG